MKKSIFPVKRVIEIPMAEHNKVYYFRTRDIAALLGIKQQFQFTADIKKTLGRNVIYKYERSEDFRFPEDLPNTTYINSKDLLEYMEHSNLSISQKIIKEKRDEIIEVLKDINCKC